MAVHRAWGRSEADVYSAHRNQTGFCGDIEHLTSPRGRRGFRSAPLLQARRDCPK